MLRHCRTRRFGLEEFVQSVFSFLFYESLLVSLEILDRRLFPVHYDRVELTLLLAVFNFFYDIIFGISRYFIVNLLAVECIIYNHGLFVYHSEHQVVQRVRTVKIIDIDAVLLAYSVGTVFCLSHD